MRHKHRFVATPFTGENAFSGKEDLFGFILECEECYKRAKPGDVIEEVRASWLKQIIPERKQINYTVPLDK